MPRAWRVVRGFERRLQRPLVCARHVDGIMLVENLRGLEKELARHVHADGEPMFNIKLDDYDCLPKHDDNLEFSDMPDPSRPPERRVLSEHEVSASASSLGTLGSSRLSATGSWRTTAAWSSGRAAWARRS